MFSAPLLIGCDLNTMSVETKTILLIKDIIAIDQYPLGKQAFRVMRKDGIEAWKKPLSGNRIAVAFLNRNSTVGSVTSSFEALELDPKMTYEVYDVWTHETVKQPEEPITAKLQPHECQVFILSLNKYELHFFQNKKNRLRRSILL
jgi:alpha-galactosidase